MQRQRPSLCPVHRPLHQVGERHGFGLGLGPFVVPGQVDQVTNESRQLLQLGVHVGQKCVPVLGRQVPHLHEHLDVGAQAGERGPQLVAGVGDQLGLLLAGGVQAPSMALKLRARRPSSSLPVSSMVADRSWVSATC